MRKFHALLILLFVVIGVLLHRSGTSVRDAESTLHEELKILRAAANHLAAGGTARPLRPRTAAFDEAGFLADVAELDINSMDPNTARQAMQSFEAKYAAALTACPAPKLKEICEALEKSGVIGEQGKIFALLCAHIAKSDPAWAVTKLDRLLTSQNAPPEALLQMFGRRGLLAQGNWNAAYAAAAEQWLKSAEADGRLQGKETGVAALRADIAAAKGELVSAGKQLAQLPHLMQADAAMHLAASLKSTPDRRHAMEQASTALQPRNFQQFASALAENAGFDAARESLNGAQLTPENHDLAAASIAAAVIDPDTKSKAVWLMEALRSEDPRALRTFAETWAHGDYNEAARWMNTLPAGAKRDAAVSGFARAAAKIEGASAADWAHTIADPLQRNRALSEVQSVWSTQDPAAAESYFKVKPIDAAALEAATNSTTP